jgi:hypothetical protein
VVDREGDYGCEQCGKLDPLLATQDGRALCIACMEAMPNLSEDDREAIEVLKMLTKLAEQPDPNAN